MKHADSAARKTGRPLSFDRNEALRKAMLTFWQSGYETTSIVDLTSAMGITAPSLYATFGDKKRLFLEAVALYAGDVNDIARAFDQAPSAYQAAADMLETVAMAFTGKDTPRGCLLASATASGSSASTEVQDAVASIRRAIAGTLQARIERDIEGGLLPAATDAAAWAGLIMAVTQGLSVLARDGASRETLLSIGKSALAGWPANGPSTGR